MDRQPVLRINPDNGRDEAQGFLLTYAAGDTALEVSVRAPPLLSPEDEESIRWYLEEYRKFPFEPASTIARSVASRLRQIGMQLFTQLFDSDARGRHIWSLVQERIETTRFEIFNDATRLALPWEIMWNPLDVVPIACRAASFVRTRNVSNHPETPQLGAAIRILLVISRPASFMDVPFRSVATRLLQNVGGDVCFEVLRPPTFDAFQNALQVAAEQHRPYSVAHFDGHGVYEDLMARVENRPASRRRGYILFENASDPDKPDYLNAPAVHSALAAGRTPILILNACRSARAETEQMGNRRPLGSFADELLQLGQPAVLAMQYNVEVETASRFVAGLYQGLLQGHSLSEAVQSGRHHLFITSNQGRPDHQTTVHDWLVPVLFESAPLSIVRQRSYAPRMEAAAPERPTSNGIVGGDDTLMALERAFQTAPVVILAGPAGSGKTTLANEFASWDRQTRDTTSQLASLHIFDPPRYESVEAQESFENVLKDLVAGGSRVLIATRDWKFSLSLTHAVVRVKPLELSEQISLLQRQLPSGVSFEPEHWQRVLKFTQGNPAVLLDLAATLTHADSPSPSSILETARSRPVGLDAPTFAAALSALNAEDLACVAIASLFEGAISSRVLRMLASAGSTSPPGSEDADVAFGALCKQGLAVPLGSRYWRMHPGLPGLLRPELERLYPEERGAAIRTAVVSLFALMCAVFELSAASGARNSLEISSQTLGLIEPTLWRALDLAVDAERWHEARNLVSALRRLLTGEGRHVEWRRLAEELEPMVGNPTDDQARVGREPVWHVLLEDRIERLVKLHSVAEADWLQKRLLQQVRAEFAEMGGAEASEYARQVFIPQLCRMGDILVAQRAPEAKQHYLEALSVAQQHRSGLQEQRMASRLVAFHLSMEPVDWKEVSYWLINASELCLPHDRLGNARLQVLRGEMALRQGQSAEAVRELRTALTVLPADPSDDRAECELKLARALFEQERNLQESMRHIQSAIAWYSRDDNVYEASRARLTASHMLCQTGETTRAFYYSREASVGFSKLAPRAESEALEAEQIATALQTREPCLRIVA